MGWTHDYGDVSRNRRASVLRRSSPGIPGLPGTAPGLVGSRLGIPRILRRRARWVGARLRQSRSHA